MSDYHVSVIIYVQQYLYFYVLFKKYHVYVYVKYICINKLINAIYFFFIKRINNTVKKNLSNSYSNNGPTLQVL